MLGHGKVSELCYMQNKLRLTFLWCGNGGGLLCGGLLDDGCWGGRCGLLGWGLLLGSGKLERGLDLHEFASLDTLVEGGTEEVLGKLDGRVVGGNVGLDGLRG